MRVANFPNMPSRMNDLWPWVMALDAWDYCDPSPLSELVKKWPIPDEFKGAVSDIIAGRRKQKRKAAAKLKIAASERMKLAAFLSTGLDVVGSFTMRGTIPSLDDIADKCIVNPKIVEPKKVVDWLNKEKREIIELGASEAGVSTETIEDLLRDLREKINKWPSV